LVVFASTRLCSYLKCVWCGGMKLGTILLGEMRSEGLTFAHLRTETTASPDAIDLYMVMQDQELMKGL